jgi:hypothetical protein
MQPIRDSIYLRIENVEDTEHLNKRKTNGNEIKRKFTALHEN